MVTTRPSALADSIGCAFWEVGSVGKSPPELGHASGQIAGHTPILRMHMPTMPHANERSQCHEGITMKIATLVRQAVAE
jgi:hypothetical protein